jgi:hypothetical protein
MREGPGNSLFMCYPGYDKEIELPCPKLSLYSVKRLLLQMEKKEPAHRNVAGPATRGRVRLSTQEEQAGPSHHACTSQMNFEETYEQYTQGARALPEAALSMVKIRDPTTLRYAEWREHYRRQH